MADCGSDRESLRTLVSVNSSIRCRTEFPMGNPKAVADDIQRLIEHPALRKHISLKVPSSLESTASNVSTRSVSTPLTRCFSEEIPVTATGRCQNPAG